jgi:hypothetical protein
VLCVASIKKLVLVDRVIMCEPTSLADYKRRKQQYTPLDMAAQGFMIGYVFWTSMFKLFSPRVIKK